MASDGHISRLYVGKNNFVISPLRNTCLWLELFYEKNVAREIRCIRNCGGKTNYFFSKKNWINPQF